MLAALVAKRIAAQAVVAAEEQVVGLVGAVDVADTRPADGRGGNGSEADTERPELPSWLKVSIFAATLSWTIARRTSAAAVVMPLSESA